VQQMQKKREHDVMLLKSSSMEDRNHTQFQRFNNHHAQRYLYYTFVNRLTDRLQPYLSKEFNKEAIKISLKEKSHWSNIEGDSGLYESISISLDIPSTNKKIDSLKQSWDSILHDYFIFERADERVQRYYLAENRDMPPYKDLVDEYGTMLLPKNPEEDALKTENVERNKFISGIDIFPQR